MDKLDVLKGLSPEEKKELLKQLQNEEKRINVVAATLMKVCGRSLCST